MAIALRFGVDFAIQCFAWAHRVPGVDKARVAFSQNASVVHFAIAARIASAIASFETAILSHGAKVSQPCDNRCNTNLHVENPQLSPKGDATTP